MMQPIEKATQMCSMGTLLAFGMISGAVLLLRFQRPDLERPYKAPYIYLVAPAGVLFNLWLMTRVRHDTWAAFLTWSLIGIGVYFLYSRKKSLLNEI